MKLSRSDAVHIWSAIEKFAKYGFNKAHSVCYALIGYQCLYLKVNYPIEFFCSILNHSSKDKTLSYIKDALHYGIKVLPVDINRSMKKFKPIGEKEILYPISHLKFIGKTTQAIVENRPYEGLNDFLEKIKGKRVNKNTIASLIRAGAFDKFGPRDKMMFRFKRAIAKNRPAKQKVLKKERKFLYKDEVVFEKWSTQDILENEELAYEFQFNDTLLEELYINLKNEYDCVNIKDALNEGGKQRIGGMIAKIKPYKTKKGTMGFVDFRFRKKQSSLTIFKDKWDIYEPMLRVGVLFYADAVVSEYNGRKNFVLSGKDRCFMKLLNQKEEID